LLSSKPATFDELVAQEHDTQNKLQFFGDDKKAEEVVLESTRKMRSDRDYSSSAVMSLVVVHLMALLKSYIPDLYPKLLHRDYNFWDDEEQERDACNIPGGTVAGTIYLQ
jgi:hypothetical protein